MNESLLAVADYGFDAMNLKVLEAYTESPAYLADTKRD